MCQENFFGITGVSDVLSELLYYNNNPNTVSLSNFFFFLFNKSYFFYADFFILVVQFIFKIYLNDFFTWQSLYLYCDLIFIEFENCDVSNTTECAKDSDLDELGCIIQFELFELALLLTFFPQTFKYFSSPYISSSSLSAYSQIPY